MDVIFLIFRVLFCTVIFLLVCVICFNALWALAVYLWSLSKTPLKKDYDYIIVGGGTTGCVLANRLTEKGNNRVLLVEAGHDDSDTMISKIRIPVFATQLPKTGVDYRVQCRRDPPPPTDEEQKPSLKLRDIFLSAGRVLGGTSCINWMLYIRPSKAEFDNWAEMGCTGWDYKTVLPIMKKAECSFLAEDYVYHDTKDKRAGPMPVSYSIPPNPLAHLFPEAANAVGIPKNIDYNGAKREGVSPAQVHIFLNGTRGSTAATYMSAQNRSKRQETLTVKTETTVKQVVFKDNKVDGIVAVDKKGKEHHIVARKEVILCAGALGSPKLLMLSGIGPKEHLENCGIGVIHDNASVGLNLRDQLTYPVIMQTRKGVSNDGVNVWKLANVYSYLVNGKGPMRTNFVESLTFLKSDPSIKQADVMLQFCPSGGWDPTTYHCLGLNPSRKFSQACTVFVTLLTPATTSEGTVRLNADDVHSNPIVDPVFDLSNDNIKRFVYGVRTAIKILSNKESDFRFLVTGQHTVPQRCLECEDDTSDIWRDHLIQHVQPTSSLAGTCAMCEVDGAPRVVDAETFCVDGVEGLRVADCSLLPASSAFATNCVAVAVGEMAAGKINGTTESAEEK